MEKGFSGAWVRGLRDGQNFTRDELAVRIGCCEASVKNWENGVVAPSPIFRHELAASLGVHPDEFDRAANADPAREYAAGVLRHARVLTDEELEPAARVLRTARARCVDQSA